MWFRYGLKAQKLLAQGNTLGISAICLAPCKGVTKPPVELHADYFKKRKALDYEIDKTLAEIQRILGINVNVDEL